jgi:hypothetical protein
MTDCTPNFYSARLAVREWCLDVERGGRNPHRAFHNDPRTAAHYGFGHYPFASDLLGFCADPQRA